MKFIQSGWVNKNVTNVINHYEKRADDFSSSRRYRRAYERLYKGRVKKPFTIK